MCEERAINDRRHRNQRDDTLAPGAEWLADYAREYGAVLKRYFLRRGASPDAAEDMVQDVYVRLAGRASRSEIKNPEAYLMQTASSVWADSLRKKRSRNEQFHVEFEDSAHSPEGFSPEYVLESRDELQRFLRALEELTPRTRQIYLLCRMDGMKRRDVARRLSISESAVDRHLMKAVKMIDQVFGEIV